MAIDIIFCLFIAYCFYRGYSKGLVMAVLGLTGYVAAILVTMYFTKQFIQWVNWKSVYAPVVCYVLLFVAVIIVFRLVGKMIEKLLEFAQINFVNKLSGGTIGIFVGVIIFSSITWLLMQVNIIKPSVAAESQVLKYIQPVGHFVVENFGKIIPPLKQWWIELKNYLQNLSK